MLMAIFFSSAE